jgi:hypothetical protein
MVELISGVQRDAADTVKARATTDRRQLCQGGSGYRQPMYQFHIFAGFPPAQLRLLQMPWDITSSDYLRRRAWIHRVYWARFVVHQYLLLDEHALPNSATANLLS